MQALRISYTATSANLKGEFDNYVWKRLKGQVEEDNHLGQEDPSCDNYLMSAARYFLLEMVKANADPEAEFRRQERERRDLAATRQALKANPTR